MEWCSIGLFVAFLCMTGAYELKIRPAGTQFTKPLGASFMFTCEAVGLESEAAKTIDVQWLSTNGSKISQNTGRIYLETEVPAVKKLYITAIQEGDNGTYTCVSSVGGVRETKAVTLQLFKEITFDYAPSPQHPRIYTDGLVMCRVSGNPRPGISWRHKGRRIVNDYRYSLEDGALRIRNITRDDDGIYSCRAEVDAEGRYDERKISVIVYVPPEITNIQKRVETVEGQQVTIQCDATGIPQPKYEFYDKDGQMIANSTHALIDKDTGTLLIHSVKKDDEGTYTCEASNIIGTASEKVELKVLIAPFIYEMNNITVSEGETVSLECLSRGEPPPVMLFFKGGDSKEIGAEHNESGRISIKQSPGHVTLTIHDVTQSDAAMYTCTSTNSAGHHDRIGLLTVNYKPYFHAGLPAVVHSWEGRIQNISCHAHGHPAPSIDWLFNGHVLHSNSTYHIYGATSGLSSLQVTTDESEQDWIYGNYTCKATNQLGQAEHWIMLSKATVPEPPVARVDERSPNHLVIMAIPNNDGGMRITGYNVEYGTTFQQLNRLTIHDSSVSMPFVVKNLTSNTTYIFRIYAKNDVGSSKPAVFNATTDEVQSIEVPPSAVISSMSTNIVIAIIISVCLVFLIIIDVSCYFINGCGLTMCICVQLCGRTKPKMTPNELEEGESKEILKETPPDMEADEAKSSQEDLEEEKHLAELCEIDSPLAETVEELVPQRRSYVEEPAPQPEERRAPSNRKSILNYGDGRWKDVVHELEAQLGVKKSHSDDDSSDEQPQREFIEDELAFRTERA